LTARNGLRTLAIVVSGVVVGQQFFGVGRAVKMKSISAQRRIPGGVLFDQPIPARTVAHLKVEHDNPQGSVTCVMPQHYRMAWS